MPSKVWDEIDYIQSQTSTSVPLKFVNGQEISSHIL